MSKLSLRIVLGLLVIALVNGQQPEIKTTGDESSRLVSTFLGLQSQVASNEQWFLKAIDEVLNGRKREGGEGKKNPLLGKEPFGKLFQSLLPKFPIVQLDKSSVSKSTLSTTTSTTSTTTTTSTAKPTTVDPMRQINRSLQEISSVLGSSGVKLLETPIKVFSGLLTTGTNLTLAGAQGLDDAAYGLVSSTKLAAVPATGHKSERRREGQQQEPMEDDLQYYEFAGPHEPYSFRRPKYFSRECPFRFACEVGKLMRPLTHPMGKRLESDRFIQDLQNRYTRAMTYGTVRGDCERYYCVLVRMLGGPAGFASGVAEIVNRVVNSDLYSDYDSSNQRRPHRKSRPQSWRFLSRRQADADADHDDEDWDEYF